MTDKAFRPEQARLVADAFARHGVDYLFIGKGGAILLGYPGATQDVDKAARRAERVENFPVMSLRDIIASKRAAGRKRDMAEMDLLEEFLKVYDASKKKG
jgi:hypothetical protein